MNEKQKLKTKIAILSETIRLIPHTAERLQTLLDSLIAEYLALNEAEEIPHSDYGYRKKTAQQGSYQDSRPAKDKRPAKIPNRKPLGQ